MKQLCKIKHKTQVLKQSCKNQRLVDWEINVPFQYKNRLYQGQGLGRRFSSARLRNKDGQRYSNLQSRPRSATTKNGKR